LCINSIKHDRILKNYTGSIEIMKVIVNGETREFDTGKTLQEILNELSLDGKVMAAAVNMNIVKQDQWSNYIVKDGDKLELLDFVGGG